MICNVVMLKHLNSGVLSITNVQFSPKLSFSKTRFLDVHQRIIHSEKEYGKKFLTLVALVSDFEIVGRKERMSEVSTPSTEATPEHVR